MIWMDVWLCGIIVDCCTTLHQQLTKPPLSATELIEPTVPLSESKPKRSSKRFNDDQWWSTSSKTIFDSRRYPEVSGGIRRYPEVSGGIRQYPSSHPFQRSRYRGVQAACGVGKNDASTQPSVHGIYLDLSGCNGISWYEIYNNQGYLFGSV